MHQNVLWNARKVVVHDSMIWLIMPLYPTVLYDIESKSDDGIRQRDVERVS